MSKIDDQIKKLEAAIKSPATPDNMRAAMQSQLEKLKAERDKPSQKEAKPKKPTAKAADKKASSSGDDPDCDELIEREKKRVAKIRTSAKKRAEMPKKRQSTKNKEAIEETASKVQKNVLSRIEKGEVTVDELQKLIDETEQLLKTLRSALQRISKKMAKGGNVSGNDNVLQSVIDMVNGIVPVSSSYVKDKKLVIVAKKPLQVYDMDMLNDGLNDISGLKSISNATDFGIGYGEDYKTITLDLNTDDFISHKFAKGGTFGKPGRSRDWHMSSGEKHEKRYPRKKAGLNYEKGGGVRKNSGYEIELGAKPNPSAPGWAAEVNIKRHRVPVKSLKEASAKVIDFTMSNEMGAGNWAGFGKLYKNGKQIGRVSYNGRVWDMQENEMSEQMAEMYAKGGTISQQMKIAKVMGEFKKGTLKSSSGAKVTDRNQAVAIALSEAGMNKN